MIDTILSSNSSNSEDKCVFVIQCSNLSRHALHIDQVMNIHDTITGRFANNGSRDWRRCVQFSTVVRWIEYQEATNEFIVKVKDLKENRHAEERFTHVIIATGLFGTAYMPKYPGLDEFKGRVLHAKDVRHAKEFQGQRVLIIGSRWSAQDLAIQFLKFGSKNVIMTYRGKPTGLTWPTGIEERPAVIKFEESSATFQDGGTADVDVVLFCTGYALNHPFLADNLRIDPEITIYPDHLYKGIVWTNGGNQKLLYLGVMYATYFLHFLDVQALWACRYITGREKKPDREDMLLDIKKFTSKRDELGVGWSFEKLEFVTNYLLMLSEANGGVLAAGKAREILQEEWKHKLEDVSSYRDHQYTSIHTGSLSTPPVVPWMEAFGDASAWFQKLASSSKED